MTSQKHIALVFNLRGRTHDGQLDWEESALPGAFEVAFSNYTIRISQDNDGYEVSILDKVGRLIESFSDVNVPDTAWMPGETSYGVFSEVYEMARRISYGVEQALNEILEELDKKDVPF